MVKYEPILKKLLPKYKRVETEKGRFYFDPINDKKLPSVTTILSKTMPEEDKQGLQKWRDNVGEEEADRITTESANLGTAVHNFLEKYIYGEDISKNIKKKNYIYQLAYRMANEVIIREMENWDAVLGSEIELCCPKLYGGTADLIFVENNTLYIGDFKTSRKIKKEEHIKNYQLQLAAYALAINEHKIEDLEIKNGKILMVDQNINFKVWKYNENQLEIFKNEWLERLALFYEK